MQVRIQLSLSILKLWDVRPNNKVKNINLNWLQFYTVISTSLLQQINYSSCYEVYLLKTTLLRRFKITHSRPLLNPFLKPTFQPARVVYHDEPKFITETNVCNNIIRENLPRKSRLFLLQLKFINSSLGDRYVIHAHNRSMFMSYDNPSWTPFINVRKVYKKWLHTYDFLLNLFFARTCVFMFAPKAMKEEAVAFNWSYGLLPFNLFKYAAPSFFMRDVPYGEEGTRAYSKLAFTGVNVAFVADINYHKKTLFHLKSTGYFVIGLVSSNLNPWLVHYSIHAGCNTLFTQYFFIRFMAYMRQQGEFFRFTQNRSLWLK